MERAQLADAIAAEREELVGDLETLDAGSWDAMSLCEGWRVRDVVAHLAAIDAYYRFPPRYVAGLVRNRFRANRFQDQDARRRARRRRPPQLLDELRNATWERTWLWRHHPAPEMMLADVMIHAEDVRRPLKIASEPDLERLALVADMIVRPASKAMRYPLGGWTLPDRRLEATDRDWSWGTGAVTRAPLLDIVMTLAGRVP